MRGGTKNDRIEHYLFTVSNLKETVRFYTEVVGLTVWKEMGSCIILSCNKGYWGFCQYDDGRPLASGVCMSLNCENTQQVDQEYQRLQSLGIKTQGAPARHPKFPVYSFFFADPDGYLLEFQKIVDEE